MNTSGKSGRRWKVSLVPHFGCTPVACCLVVFPGPPIACAQRLAPEMRHAVDHILPGWSLLLLDGIWQQPGILHRSRHAGLHRS